MIVFEGIFTNGNDCVNSSVEEPKCERSNVNDNDKNEIKSENNNTCINVARETYAQVLKGKGSKAVSWKNEKKDCKRRVDLYALNRNNPDI